MSYRIVYGPMPNPPKEKTSPRFRVMIAAFLLLFILGVRIIWPEGRAILQELLLPGAPTVTELALQDMMENLRHGAAMGESITAFCRQVIHGEVD